ncbi:MAG: histidine phosphatase family protein [Pseudomonadota bacterium]
MTNQITTGLKSGQGTMAAGELIVIRHGMTVSPDRLNGRTDVALAEPPNPVVLVPTALWASPAIRAQDTATGLFPGVELRADERLWEQDFGAIDGTPFRDLPDIGVLSKADLADLRAKGGENFHDMVARAEPALREAAMLARGADGPVVLVAHAGIVRVALAMAMGNAAAALSFQISYLGATRLTCYASGFAVTAVNEQLF